MNQQTAAQSIRKEEKIAPWEEQEVNIDIEPLIMNKFLYDPGQLRVVYGHKIGNLPIRKVQEQVVGHSAVNSQIVIQMI